MLGRYLDRVREASPLVHCITNYVTVNDVANAILAVGGSPIMSDEPDEVADITAICDALDLNIGTLNGRTIEGMRRCPSGSAATSTPSCRGSATARSRKTASRTSWCRTTSTSPCTRASSRSAS